jgi:iron complex outermembrane receptor protein
MIALIAAGGLTMISSLAHAQTAPAPSDTVDEVVVTGYRAALQSALSLKRSSNVMVDAINAEDIADFPDANLAESLQRLPGVSIDRDNGEGRTITVRGLGSDFTRVRLNGLEALSTAGSNDSGTSPNRGGASTSTPSRRSCSARCACRRPPRPRPTKARWARPST